MNNQEIEEKIEHLLDQVVERQNKKRLLIEGALLIIVVLFLLIKF